MKNELHAPTRRELLLGSGTLFAWAYLPKVALAEGRDPRMLVIVLRGALDGLAAVAPVGDPDWMKLRGDKALVLDGKTPALPLDSFFALNPDRHISPKGGEIFAVGPVTPLVVRGPAPVLTWSPRRLLPASDDTVMR